MSLMELRIFRPIKKRWCDIILKEKKKYLLSTMSKEKATVPQIFFKSLGLKKGVMNIGIV
jgi:hypothetical protein